MALNESLRKEFIAILGEDSVFTNDADLLSYAYDSAVLEPKTPKIVLAPSNEEELGKTVRLAYENDLPITVRGSGTNLSGATIPEKGDSAVILTSKLNRILEINENDLYAVVEPGVINARLFDAAMEKGLFYPPDPGSNQVSTLGGNVALNAGGLRGLKYGVTKDYLMGLEFFDYQGQLVKTGSRTIKCVTGYNLAGLMLASEGTLGVFSKLILKLLPPPAASQAMMAIYKDVNTASQTVAAIIAAKILPSTLEFLDQKCIKTVEASSKIGLPTDAGAILLIEVDGNYGPGVQEDAEKVRAICQKCGATGIKMAKDEAEKNSLWEARRNTLPSLARLRPTTVLEDATVPRSRVPEMVEAIERMATKYNLEVGTFGHAGDGNLHPTILCDKRDRQEFSRVEAMIDEIFDVAIKLQGTLSGEHGIGIAKVKYMEKETNKATIDFSKRLKKAIDPKYLFNSQKIFP
ncbi:MAG: FAD-binding protein [Deltaproteobacteria bacterium]|jgi:glycolate oxidase|nr:FAD-binding protein [Deltaproteobacteria bacterium]